MKLYEKEKIMEKGNKLKKEEMEELSKKIEDALAEFIKEGKYKDVLIAMGNIGQYSLFNQIFILMQKPDARTTYGLSKWNSLGRRIKKGERSIKIYSPITRKETVDGEEKNVLKGFHLSSVFDISQTEGEDISAFLIDESKVVENKDAIVEGLRKEAERRGFSLRFVGEEELGEGCYGSCNHKKREIKVLTSLSDLSMISTLAHECGHALAHSCSRSDFMGLSNMEKREIKEVEAESIACIVSARLGLDTENFNFSYISGWAKGDISKFRHNLSLVRECAYALLQSIEEEIETKNARVRASS